jgi:plastocyanin
VAPAKERVAIELENRDSGVPHNISVYRGTPADDAAKPVFVGHIATGVTTASYVFKSPDAGVYYFRCDLSPSTMSGTLLVE